LTRYAGKYDAIKVFYNNLTSNPSQEKYRYHGYKGFNIQLEPSQYSIPLRSRTCLMDNDLRPLMENFIMETQNMGIELVLVYAPEHIGFQKGIVNRDEFINYYKFLAEKYSLKFLDYSKDPICSDPRLFYNHLHLNQIGSDIFSRKLAMDLKNQIH
jgi:hypothetical protein